MTINVYSTSFNSIDSNVLNNIHSFVSYNDRVIVCINIRDYLGAGVTNVTVTDASFSVPFTKVAETEVISSGPGKLYSQIWISDKSIFINGLTFNIEVFPGFPVKIATLNMAVSGLNSDDARVFDTATVTTGGSTQPQILTTTPTNIPNSLVIANWSWDQSVNSVVVPPSGGFLYLGSNSYPGYPYNEGLTAAYASKITNASADSAISIWLTSNWNAIGAVFAGVIEDSRLHNTDSILKIVGSKDHTTDSALMGVYSESHSTDLALSAENSVLHTSDTLLQLTSEIQHFTDVFINPPQRPPILRQLLVSSVPSGVNVGQFKVKILGVHGNDLSEDNLDYTINPQEFVVGKNQTNQISIIDPIIKKTL